MGELNMSKNLQEDLARFAKQIDPTDLKDAKEKMGEG